MGTRQQPRRRAAELRLRRSAGAHQELGHELRVQRTDPSRPHLVLLQRADDRHLSGRGRPLRQLERVERDLWSYAKDESVKSATPTRSASSPRASPGRHRSATSSGSTSTTRRTAPARRTPRQRTVPLARRRLDRLRARHRPRRPDHLARVGHHLGCARQDHAGVLLGALVEPRAGGSRLLLVLDRVGDIRPVGSFVIAFR
jgi:hypothetical protein